ncbi:MAG: S1 RNA-binding domain-containing protein [Firmicutes bacterium]|nr:S1 RNA-binding domain-containing protein [[Eubacterium] siraeum]MCM1488368.1 S1 RNA-binding domain-containing protein [Bacillota bacterium]
MSEFYPEGELINTEDNRISVSSEQKLQECILSGKILEAPCIVCDSRHNLIVDFGFMKGIIPRTEGAIGIDNGTTRDIALISRVNKAVCFKITAFVGGEYGEKMVLLSRKKAQQQCYGEYISRLSPGDIINAKVTHLEQFGSFVDIGCGIPSLIPIDSISVSRINHPSNRMSVGQNIKAVVKSVEGEKISLSHKELLGTWTENAANFKVGETVTGYIRSVENYGVFVELTPNLAGLAELKDNIHINQHASVFIKAIIPEKMKIKLIIVDTFDSGYTSQSFKYFIDSGHIDSWVYSTPESDKIIKTVF